MKKLLILAIALIVGLSFASAQDFTIYNPTAPVQILTADTLGNAGTDSVTVLIKIPKGIAWNYSIIVTSENVSGTSEGYVDLYQSLSNDSYLEYDLVATRVADDTLTSSNLNCVRTDTDGFGFRYLKLLLTNKAQAQSTIYNAWIYPYKDQ